MFLTFGQTLLEDVRKFLTKWIYAKYCIREITVTYISSGHGYVYAEGKTNEEKNQILHKAIKLKLSSLSFELPISKVSRRLHTTWGPHS